MVRGATSSRQSGLMQYLAAITPSSIAMDGRTGINPKKQAVQHESCEALSGNWL